jgi:hypothetical protein
LPLHFDILSSGKIPVHGKSCFLYPAVKHRIFGVFGYLALSLRTNLNRHFKSVR